MANDTIRGAKQVLTDGDPATVMAAIEKATTVGEMDALRLGAVRAMHQQRPDILSAWQQKYQSLRCCPACGAEKP